MNFGDFSNMFAKMKETLKQSLNLKPINNEIYNISKDFISLTKKNDSEITNDSNYGKYELSYNHASTNDYIVELNNILYLALVSFHQKKGSVVECTFPSMEKIINEPNEELKGLVEENDSKNNSVESVINNINSQLVNYSLMDGIHLVDNDTEIYFLHNLKKPIYCLSYYVQVKTGNGHPQKEDSFQDNIRECIQKAICIVSLKPIFTHKLLYQHFYTCLTTQMNAFMQQDSLNDKSKLKILYDLLYKKITLIDLNKDQWLLNIRKLYCNLRNDIFTILKLILCEQNIIIYSQIPSNVSLFIITLLFMLPGEICQELSNYDIQNQTPFRIIHDNYLIYPLFTLFDLSPLIEKIKNNANFHYIIGTSNFLVANSKDINYACIINVDELTVTYNENLNENLISVNSNENKIIDDINKIINNNIIKEGLNKDYDYSKKININEEWIISSDNVKKNIKKEYDFILKKIRYYFMNISFDVNYLINEIKQINDNNGQNNTQIKLKEINEEINNKFNKYINQSQSQENQENQKNKEENKNSEQPDKKDEEIILPRIDEAISDPYIYLLTSKLSFSINNQIDMGLMASPPNLEIPKDFNSSLSNLNILTFVSFWLKSKNFKNWFLKNKEQIINLSILNNSKSSVTKIYDYKNNEYSGLMRFGKKNGKGKLIYVKKGMSYVGQFKNDLKDGKGNFFSNDNLYLYDGDWKSDKYHGKGSLLSPKEGKYVGEFKNGIFDGKGCLIDINNNIFNGTFINGKKNGAGELSMTNGNKYIGNFKDDKYNGNGKIVDSKGNIIQEGIYKDGVFVPPKKKNDKEEKEKNEKNDGDNIKNNNDVNLENTDKEKEKQNGKENIEEKKE